MNLTSSEYLEYYPDNNTALKFDRFGNCEKVEFSGEMPEIENGAGGISIHASGKASLPVRFTATVGVEGEKIK